MKHALERSEMRKETVVVKPGGKSSSENLGVDGRIILEWI
jgi:hypothetical protein